MEDEDGVPVYRITNRGGKGVKTINVTEKTGRLVGIMDVSETEDLIITCRSGKTLRTPISSIKESSRNTQGVTLIKVDSKDAIASISKVNEQEEEVVLGEDGLPIVAEGAVVADAITEIVPEASEEVKPENNTEEEDTNTQEL